MMVVQLSIRFLLPAVLTLAATCTPSQICAGELAKIPVVLDTDIGTDIDDAFALALAVASPELAFRGVTTVSDDAYTRAMIVCRFLSAVGRADVPVASGRPPRDEPATQGQYQYGLRPARKRPGREDAVEFLYREVKANPGKLTIVTVGDLSSIGDLITRHPDCKSQIRRIVIMGGSVRVGYRNRPPPEPEWNIKSDVRAARFVFLSGIPLVVAPLDATTMVKLEAPLRREIFGADTPLTRELATLYDLWNKPTPVLFDAVAVTLCFTERFCRMEELRLEVDDRGLTREVDGEPNARVATSIRREEFLRWYVDRIIGDPIVVRLSADGALRVNNEQLTLLELPRGLERLAFRRADANVEIRTQRSVEGELARKVVGLCRDAGIERVTISPNDGSPRFGNVTTTVPSRGMPSRVHVFEDYETDIERRWWLAGRIETENAPRSLSASSPNRRACRAIRTRNFDGTMGDQSSTYKAVIFNPVPGPPMGPRTRLSFRYFLTGTDRMRVQIYSLTKGYHRCLTLAGLPQRQWRSATVDMTRARRPDGSGGPLAENERIDDIQFYIDPGGDLLIDDIVLFEEADEDETRPFPRRLIFTGWFDTGRQGVEWPGDFEIVPHEKPQAWKAARSVINEKSGWPWIRIHLRGKRAVGEQASVSFRYKLTGTRALRAVIADGATGQSFETVLEDPTVGRWTAAELVLSGPAKTGPLMVDELRFLPDEGGQLLIDDVLIYESGG